MMTVQLQKDITLTLDVRGFKIECIGIIMIDETGINTDVVDYGKIEYFGDEIDYDQFNEMNKVFKTLNMKCIKDESYDIFQEHVEKNFNDILKEVKKEALEIIKINEKI